MPLLKIALLPMSAHNNDQSANLRKGDQFCRLAKELNIAIAVHPMAVDKKGCPQHPLVIEAGFREGVYIAEKEPRGHRMSLTFLCSSPAEVDSLYQQVIQTGYQGYKKPWEAFWGQRYAIIQDPDGNLIDLFANRVS
jgi:hypothetical protein